MVENIVAKVDALHASEDFGRFQVEPLERGFGLTLGNALRRVLLSSLEGAAVTSIQVRDVYQEFSTIPGVKEDVTQIVLNVKKLRLKSFATHPVQLRLVKSGAGAVTAPAPLLISRSWTGWVAKLLSRSFLTFRTIWVTSSLTPGIVENSW